MTETIATVATPAVVKAAVADAAEAILAPKAPKVAAPKKAAPKAPTKVTKALRPLKPAASFKGKELKVNDETVKVVRTSTSVRIDHSACKHATTGPEGKKARAACRARVESSLKK